MDSFAALLPGAVRLREDVPQDLYDQTFPLFNSLVSPWHQFLDPVRYGHHVESVAALPPNVVISTCVHPGDLELPPVPRHRRRGPGADARAARPHRSSSAA